MANLGIKNVKIALVDEKGHVIKGTNGIFKDITDTKGIFTADQDTAFGVASVAFSNLTGTFTDIYGSNKVVWKAAGKSAPQAILTVNALPIVIKQAILGHESDGKGGFKISGKANPDNRVAFLVESRESFNDDAPIYVAMFMGVATEASHTFTSSNATENRTTDVITISEIERGDEGFGSHWFSASANFKEADMMAKAFPTKTQAPVVKAP